MPVEPRPLSRTIRGAMPPGGGGGGEHGYREQENPPVSGHGCRDEETPSRSPPQPCLPGLAITPVISEKKKGNQKHDQQEEEEPAASFPEDVLIEILSRVPYRSLCRFTCVSKPWLALCSDPDIRKKSPQTLSGFFYNCGWRFLNWPGRGPPMVDPSLPFLSSSYKYFTVLQCSTSLLLCKCWISSSRKDGYDLVVCNPAIGKWGVFPPIQFPEQDNNVLYIRPTDIFLGFDPAVPSRFMVFAPLTNHYGQFKEVAIYSSETGGWTYMQGEWNGRTILVGNSECVFLNGTMHLTTHYDSIVTVDMQGKAWREIEMPEDMANHYGNASIGQSQGRLYAWNIYNCQLSVWVLEDFDSGQWTLKHTVNVLELFGGHCHEKHMFFKMFAIHPHCNLIFLTAGVEKTLSYDMDSQTVNIIYISEALLDGLPYTPCFTELP